MKVLLIAFVIILALSTFLKVAPIQNGNFPFTTDQGRDMLDLRQIVFGRHLPLIGPTTSINGVYLGPFWYLFNVTPFLIGFGNPTHLVYWMILWYQLTAIIFVIFTRRQNLLFGLTFSSLLLMTPVFFYASRYSWSANPMPFMTSLFFLCLLLANPKSRLSYLCLGLIIGLSLQIEAAFAILFFPFALLWLILARTSWRSIAIVAVTFDLTLLPQIFFELRHQFVMTNTLLREFGGQTAILGNRLNFVDTFQSHLSSYLSLIDNLSGLPDRLPWLTAIAALIYLTYKLVRHQLEPLIQKTFLASVLFILFSFGCYLLYPYSLKGWFILGLHIPFLLILASAMAQLFHSRNYLQITPIAALLLLSFFNVSLTQTRAIPSHPTDRSSDPSNFRNQLEVVDFVYTKAAGQPLKVYDYIPSVYDFPYQYLFWWHGTHKYGYQPDTITYLDNVPNYITNNAHFWTKRKPVIGDNYPIFLISQTDPENPDRLHAWLNNFEKLCPDEATVFDFSTTVQIRRHCQLYK